jgi:hypothetical protein
MDMGEISDKIGIFSEIAVRSAYRSGEFIGRLIEFNPAMAVQAILGFTELNVGDTVLESFVRGFDAGLHQDDSVQGGQ